MRAIFLDRDGVINENRSDHVKTWDEFQFLPGSLEAMRLLSEAGYPLFIVTNQAIINRGIVTVATVEMIHQRMLQIMQKCGIIVEDLRYCPHRPDEGCACRKPAPGMLMSLIQAHQIDPQTAIMIGDALTDIAAAQACGCRTIMVRTGRGAIDLAEKPDTCCLPDLVVDDLLAAARWIIAEQAQLQSPADAHVPTLVGCNQTEPSL